MRVFGSLFVAALASILAAGLAAGLGLSAWTGEFGPELVFFMAIAAVVAVPHFLFLGLPLFLTLGARGPVGWRQVGLGGFLIGGLPVPLLALGNYTAAWNAAMLGEMLRFMLWLGSSGVAGALAFRAAYGPELGGLAE